MRILFISSFVYKSYNGAAIFAQLFLQWGKENEHHIDVVSTENHPDFIPCSPSSCSAPVYQQYDISYKYYSAIAALDYASYDVIYFNNVIESYYTVQKLAHSKIFAFLHDSQYMNDVFPNQSTKRKLYRYFLRRIEQKSIKKLTEVHTNSLQMSKQIQSIYKCSRNKIKYMFFSSLDLHPKEKASSGSFTILFIRTNYVSGGLFNLIEAANSLSFDYRLLVLGPPKEDHELIKKKTKASEVEIYDHKTREEMPAIYAQADVLINCAFTEPMGIGNFEAMKMGVPVIGNDVEGIAEIALASKAILLYDKNSTSDLAQKIKMIKEDSSLRNELVNQGKEYINTSFTKERIFHNLTSLIKK